MSGRYIEISILPFSFKEYLEIRGIKFNNKYLNYTTLFFDYVNETSLPKGIGLRSEGFDKIYEYLNSIYDTIIEKDIVQRYKISNRRAFEKVAWEISNPATANREFKSLEAIKDNFPKYLLTTESFPQSRNGIKHINVFEWLLQMQDFYI